MKILLVGQPNCGKTTLFNRLTGRQEHTGNRAGVTVTCVRARLKGTGEELVDLPGLYSFTGGGPDEQAARRAIQNEAPDIILNVIDSTALVRGLTLTMQLISLHRPMTVLLNMTDEARRKGIYIDPQQLFKELGVPVFPISARTGEGLNDPSRFLKAARTSHIGAPTTREDSFYLARKIGERATMRRNIVQKTGADRRLIHPLWGLPIFGLILGLVFLITFQWVGPWLSEGIARLLGLLKDALANTPLDRPVVTDGLLGSAGYVLSFLPIITVLSLLLTLLEDVGYLPRAAFLLDGWLKELGLDGRCAVPLLLGFGCSVPAVMATRTLPESDLRRSTVQLLPFVPCSARLPFLLLLGGILFPDRPARGALLFYGLSLLAGVVYGSIAYRNCAPAAFYLELPPLRLPRWQSVVKETEKHMDHFLRRAGLILLPTAFILWAAFHVNTSLHSLQPGEESLLSALGRLALPLLRPLGLDDWRSGVILLSGVAARETMASAAALFIGDGLQLSWEQAVVLGAVSLLLPPCAGTLMTVRGELGFREMGKMILRQFLFAWWVGFILHGLLHIIPTLIR